MFNSKIFGMCFILITLMVAVGCDDRSDAPAKQETEGNANHSSKVPEVKGFTGTFHALVQGSTSVITLQQNGKHLSGTIENAALNGEVANNVAKGSLTDSSSGEVLPLQFTFMLSGDKLNVQLAAKNPETGEVIQIPEVIYARQGSGTAAKPNQQNAAKSDNEHDPALVGAWRYTYTASGGGASVAVDDWIYINADGTFREGDSRAAGGNADVGIESSGDGAGFSGYWRSSDNHLQLKQEGSEQWVPLARYYVEGDKMLFTFGDGSKKIWYRQ